MGWKDLFWKSEDGEEEGAKRPGPRGPATPGAPAAHVGRPAVLGGAPLPHGAAAPVSPASPASPPSPGIADPSTATPELSDAEFAEILAGGGGGGGAPATGTMMLPQDQVERITAQSVGGAPAGQSAVMQAPVMQASQSAVMPAPTMALQGPAYPGAPGAFPSPAFPAPGGYPAPMTPFPGAAAPEHAADGPLVLDDGVVEEEVDDLEQLWEYITGIEPSLPHPAQVKAAENFLRAIRKDKNVILRNASEKLQRMYGKLTQREQELHSAAAVEQSAIDTLQAQIEAHRRRMDEMNAQVERVRQTYSSEAERIQSAHRFFDAGGAPQGSPG